MAGCTGMDETTQKDMNPTVALDEVLLEFCSASPQDRPRCLKTAVKAMKEALKSGETDAVMAGLRRVVSVDLDYTTAQSLRGVYSRLRPVMRPSGRTIRLAVAGSFTTTQLSSLIELFLFAGGVEVDLYEAGYGVFRQEILDPSSGLYAFEPEYLFIASSRRDLGNIPSISETPDALEALVESECAEWFQLWLSAYERSGCQIIQNNFDPPPWRVLSNYEMCHFASPAAYVERINRELQSRAPAYVTIHDVSELAAGAGRRVWGDERFFHHAKLPCAPEFLVDYAHNVASILLAQLGMSKKCVVLDLDNTLWGGVIGDDGLGGIRLGQGNAEGEAYLGFQHYLKALQNRGVILAVCSKNDEANAREVFEKHPEMVLRLEDISCFTANWTDKATNLRSIAETLNIGLNSLVFVDDNPAERDLVRRFLPEVAVPELPEDPSGYAITLDRYRYFQVVTLSGEDFNRTGYYRGNAGRKQAEASSGDLDEFLQSLHMVATVRPIDLTSLERSVQLIQRSNQFNLTTRRHSISDVTQMITDERWLTLTISLSDRFGDNGLISVLLAREQEGRLVIDTWLMSCRVLKRGVEVFLMNQVVERARQRGLDIVVGEYIPSAKNGMVSQLYADLGFTLKQTGADGTTWWEYEIRDSWCPAKTYIEERRSDG